jgi:hypothetical protein
MSALPPKADIHSRDQDVCFGPIGDIDGLHVVAKLSSTYHGSARALRSAFIAVAGALERSGQEDVQGKQNGKCDPNSNVHVALWIGVVVCACLNVKAAPRVL